MYGFAHPGEHMLLARVASGLPLVRAYAASQGTGYGFILLNLDKSTTRQLTVNVAGAAGLFAASTRTYGKEQYDASRFGAWLPPISATLGNVSLPLSMTLPPWSITLLSLEAH